MSRNTSTQRRVVEENRRRKNRRRTLRLEALEPRMMLDRTVGALLGLDESLAGAALPAAPADTAAAVTAMDRTYSEAVTAGGDLRIGGGGTVTFEREVTVAGDLVLTGLHDVIFGADVRVGGNVVIEAADDLDFAVAFQAGGDFRLTSDTAIVFRGSLETGTDGVVSFTAPTVRNEGTLNADSGRIVLTGAYVGNWGTIAAPGTAGESGGSVTLHSTVQTLVAPSGLIDVSGGDGSGGGSIVLLSDANTTMAGTLLARGGAAAGDGGFVEISSDGGMVFVGTVDTAAPAGDVGVLLLDPKNVTFVAAGGVALGDVDEFSDSPAGNVDISVGTITGAGAAVTIQANTDIIVGAALVGMAQDLTLQAGRSVLINASIGLVNKTLSITANDPGAIADNRDDGAGSVTMAAGTQLTAGNGGITLTVGAGAVAPWTPGSITVDSIATTGTLALVSGGSIVEAGAGDDAVDLTAGTLSLTVNDAGATIGQDGNPLEIQVATLNATTNNGYAGLKNVGNNGPIMGNIGLGVVNVGDQILILDAVGCSITDAAGGAGPSNITAGAANLTTTGTTFAVLPPPFPPVTVFGGAIGTADRPIRTSLNTLSATTDDGGIYLANSEKLAIVSVIAKERGFTPAMNANGEVVINQSEVGTHDVALTAQGHVAVDTVKAPKGVTIEAGAGRILDLNQSNTNLIARTMNLKASESVGVEADAIETAVMEISAQTTDGGVFIAEADGGKVVSVVAGGAGNKVILSNMGGANATSGAFRIGTITATDGIVTVQNHVWSVLDDNGAALNITGQKAEFLGKTGVGTTTDPIDTAVSELVATASDALAGIFLTDTDGLTSVSAKTNDGDVTINFTGGPLKFVAGTDVLSASGAAVTFENTGGDIAIAVVNAGTSAVTLTAAGAILDNTNDSARDIIAGTATLSAGTAIGASGNELDTSVDALKATATNGGIFVDEATSLTLDASASGADSDVLVVNAAGDMTLGRVSATDQVALGAAGSILDNNGNEKNIVGGSATLWAGGAIGSSGDPLESAVSTLTATASGGGLFLDNSGSLNLTIAKATGADLSVGVFGNLSLGQVMASGQMVTLTASGHMTDGNGGDANVTSADASLTGTSIGTVADPIDTAVSRLAASATGGGIYVAQTGELKLISATALGDGSGVGVAVTGGSLVLGAVAAKGDDVSLSATGAITDGNLDEPNVIAKKLTISAPDGIGTADDKLELDVNDLDAAGGAGGVAAVNAGPLALTEKSFQGKGAFVVGYEAESITIVDIADNLALLDTGGSVELRTQAGNIVFLDANDTIRTQGTGSITIQAGLTPGSAAVAVVGNLKTDGGNIIVTAGSHVTIGQLDAGAGDVTVASQSGVIIDGNGPATNIIGNVVTVSGALPEARTAELWTIKKMADASAAVAEAAAKDSSYQSWTAGEGIMIAEEGLTKTAYDEALADSTEKDATNEEWQKAALGAKITATILDTTAFWLGFAVDVVEWPESAAQAVPLTGDGGASTVKKAVETAKEVFDALAWAAGLIADQLDDKAGDTQVEATEARAVLIAAYDTWQLAIETREAFSEAKSIAKTAWEKAVIARDHAAVVETQAIAAEEQTNAVGTAGNPLQIDAGTINIAAGDGSIYLAEVDDVALGDLSAMDEGAEIIVTAPGDISVRGQVEAATWVSLNAGNRILDGNGVVVAPDFQAVAAHGIGAADPAVPAATGSLHTQVDPIAADGGDGGVSITNDTDLVIGTVHGVAGVTAAGTVSLTSTGGAIRGDDSVPVDVTAATLAVHAATGVDLDTDIGRLTGAATAGAVVIREKDALALANITSLAGSVTITAGGAITSDVVDGVADVTAATITLQPTTPGAGIGVSAANPLEVNATALLNAGTNNGSIFITDTLGGVAVGALDGDAASGVLKTLAGGNIAVTRTGSFTLPTTFTFDAGTGAVIVNADTDLPDNDPGTGATVNLLGPIIAAAVQITTGGDGDSLQLRNSTGAVVTIDTGGGNDTVQIDKDWQPGAGSILNGGGGYDAVVYDHDGLGGDDYAGPVTVNLATGTANSVGTFSNVERFEGTSSTGDLLRGADAVSVWHITGVNGGDIGGAGVFDFAGFENLNGGTLDDTFMFAEGGSITGNLDAGLPAASDTIDYHSGDYNAAATVVLDASNGGTATAIGGRFDNVEKVIGDADFGAVNSLTSDDSPSVWTYTGVNEGNINNQFFFQYFGDVQSGSGNDAFTVGDNTLPGGTIDGGGNGTLQSTWTGEVIWHITGDNAGYVETPAGTFEFAGMGTLIGGSGEDAFVFSDGKVVTDGVYGGGGEDTLDMRNYASRNVWSRENEPGLLETDFGNFLFGSIENVVEGNNTTFRFWMPDLIGTFKQMGLQTPTLVGSSGPIQLEVKNIGNVRIWQPIDLAFYLSLDDTVDAGDILIAQAENWSIKLFPGFSKVWSGRATVPAGTAPGVYHVLAAVDAGNDVAELNQLNNTTVAATTVEVQQRDLTGTLTQMTLPADAIPGDTGRLSLRVDNIGNRPLTDPIELDFVLSQDLIFGNADDLPLHSVANWPTGIAANGSKTYAATVAIPAGTPAGTYHVLARVDAQDQVGEIDETNNDAAADTTVTVAAAFVDLVGTVAVTAPNASVPGDSARVTVTVTNQGNIPAVGRIALNGYLSLDPALDTNADREWFGRDNWPIRLDPGATATATFATMIPYDLPAGTYYVFADIDPNNVIAESNKANNQPVVATPQEVVWEFGDLDRRIDVRLRVLDENGTLVTFSMNKIGVGTVLGGPAFDEVVVAGTTYRSTLNITTAGRGSATAVNNITIKEGQIRGINAPTTDLKGDLKVEGAVGNVTMRNVAEPHTIRVLGAPTKAINAVSFAFQRVQDLVIHSPLLPINTLKVVDWQDTDAIRDTITAPSIASLQVTGQRQAGIAGDFDADLILTGQDARGQSLGKANIAGTATTHMNLKAAAGTIVMGAWNGGGLYTTGVASLTVRNRLDGVELIVAGNLGKGSVGTFGSGSILAVGVNPGAGGYFDGDETATGGVLGTFVASAYDKEGTAPFGIVMDTLGRRGPKLAGRTLTAGDLPLADGQFQVRLVS